MLKAKGQDTARGDGPGGRTLGDRADPKPAKQNEAIQAQMQAFMLNIPNLPHDSVPAGQGDADQNQEVRRWGEPKAFGFEVPATMSISAVRWGWISKPAPS